MGQPGADKAGGPVRVVAVREDPNGVIAIDFEILVGMESEVVWHSTVRVQVDGDSFKYLSCKYYEGA